MALYVVQKIQLLVIGFTKLEWHLNKVMCNIRVPYNWLIFNITLVKGSAYRGTPLTKFCWHLSLYFRFISDTLIISFPTIRSQGLSVSISSSCQRWGRLLRHKQQRRLSLGAGEAGVASLQLQRCLILCPNNLFALCCLLAGGYKTSYLKLSPFYSMDFVTLF